MSVESQDLSEINILIDKKWEILTQYLSITELLNSKLDIDDLTEVIHLLNKRKTLIQNIQNIEGQIMQMVENETALDNILEHKEKSYGLYELLKRIEAIEKKCLAKADQKLNHMKQEISEKKHMLKITKSYTHQSLHQPRFLDVMR